MAKRIIYPGSSGYSSAYDVIVETAAELTTDSDLIALDPFAMAICLNTDIGTDAACTLHIKLSDGSWKKV
jgi:hypothetical protein